MFKRTALMILFLICVLVLTACGCRHETWIDADCVTPKTCAECGEIEGEALGHSWVEASCDEPKTCTICSLTEGGVLGHSWVEASCDEPKTCTTCSLTEGSVLGHSWVNATTEAPKTCSVCAVTEGERIITDSRFTTAACQPLFGSWQGQMTLTAEENGLTGVEGEVIFDVVFTFYEDGKATQMSTYADWESTKLLFQEYIAKAMYSEMALQGLDAAAAEAKMQSEFRMTVEEYAEAYVDAIDLDAVYEPVEMVYYMDGSNLHMGYDWDGDMQISMVSIEEDKLIMITLPDLTMMELTKITEQ